VATSTASKGTAKMGRGLIFFLMGSDMKANGKKVSIMARGR